MSIAERIKLATMFILQLVNVGKAHKPSKNDDGATLFVTSESDNPALMSLKKLLAELSGTGTYIVIGEARVISVTPFSSDTALSCITLKKFSQITLTGEEATAWLNQPVKVERVEGVMAEKDLPY